MRAGGSAMVRGSAITKQGDSLNYPRNYHDDEKYRKCYKVDR